MRVRSVAPVALVVLLGACSTNPSKPILVAGGGATGGTIAGELNVYVIAQSNRAPIIGATVTVSSPKLGTPQTVTTDATGLAHIKAGALEGAQTVTASAASFVPQTWYGANARNLTLVLRERATISPPTASVTGTIAGWEALPEPEMGHRTVAFVSYSRRYPLDSIENDIATPMRTITVGLQSVSVAGNSCLRTPLVTDCNFQLTTRIGPQAVYAIIVDVDTKNTIMDTDDVAKPIGYAVLRGLDLASAQTMTGLTLTQIPMTDVVNTAVNFGTPPAGLTAKNGYSVVDLGDEGLMLTSAVTPAMPAAVLPRMVGALAGARIDFGASADDNAQLGSSLWQRAIDPAVSVNLGAWLPPPTQLAVVGTTLSYAPVNGAEVHTIEVLDAEAHRNWTGVMLDNVSSLTLPTLTPDPFAGTASYVVSAARIPSFDPMAFDNDDVQRALTATSSESAQFTR